ncbi:UNVERIFIED_CONTAM: hypothetical protein GTU68_015235 [Idotea baltica]|nr:hypothetical protein [Idotea baltica]
MVWLLIATSKDNGIDESSSTGHSWDGIEELNNPLPRWWLGVFILSIIFAVLYLFLYPGLGNYGGSLGWTQTAQFEDNLSENRAKQDLFFADFADLSIQEISQNETAMSTAERLFLNNCATCHGSDARGAKGFPNLSDDDWLYGGSPENILHTITNGRAGIMPNLAVTPSNATLLAYYIQGLAGMETTQYALERGKSLFVVCTSCHGPEGKGNQALGAPNLTDDIWLHGSRIPEIETIILNGKTGNMPSFNSLLSENEIKLLAAYVFSLRAQ